MPEKLFCSGQSSDKEWLDYFIMYVEFILIIYFCEFGNKKHLFVLCLLII